MFNFIKFKFILILFLPPILFGCMAMTPNIASIRATSGPEYITSIHRDLVSLPKPENPIPVAVYKFRDQTGQYKAPGNATNFSTAVTQGATSILIKALEDSGWFLPVEREGLANLLQERKIVLQMRELYLTEEQKKQFEPLPPLLYAGIIFEGGIIGYDSNVTTGGIGAKYFGAGGSAEYRVDKVSIYLRAVSVKNGAVLKTVQTSKTVLSQMLSLGIFRFVRLNRLLEAEAGIAANEPVEMAVQEAIEKAVYDIIIEGVKTGIWKPKDTKEFEKWLSKYENELKEKTFASESISKLSKQKESKDIVKELFKY
ncbi:MAG: CsgG/HfaB family protein [Thermodesulfovibrio sp.]|uniref:CsgG/HfaB family protein n=1 Tax=unclassified Thermodesulfovibrio TaxID=2645936 RepID=UPI00083B85D3|nr:MULTISPECIES: CsgG/HfaB family protein [unclassified Thermodesulfovibrio]MDI1472780.1 CsgG/HfaB family protein [Thermodesulfovibrio sp. 1176]MDI6713479.1 CsgG/HfaB family protein [Thermodesulfovibrio sp.]ODA44575.1 Curli production assembly/transport component CsgG [Thermodesulfovibrio sp. N1]